MPLETECPSVSPDTELRVALGLIGAWLFGALVLFAFLPGGTSTPSHYAAIGDMWGVRLPGTPNTRPGDADIPGSPHEVAEEEDGQQSLVRNSTKLAGYGGSTLDASIADWTSARTPGVPAFSSDGTFLGTVCCVGLTTADHIDLQISKGGNRYSLNIPTYRLGMRGNIIEIAMTLNDIHRAARITAPECG